MKFSENSFDEAAAVDKNNGLFTAAFDIAKIAEHPYTLKLNPETVQEGYYVVTTTVDFTLADGKTDKISFETKLHMFFPYFNISAYEKTYMPDGLDDDLADDRKFRTVLVTDTETGLVKEDIDAYVVFCDDLAAEVDIFKDVIDPNKMANASIKNGEAGVQAPVYKTDGALLKWSPEDKVVTAEGNLKEAYEVTLKVVLDNGCELDVAVVRSQTPAAATEADIIGERGKLNVCFRPNGLNAAALGTGWVDMVADPENFALKFVYDEQGEQNVDVANAVAVLFDVNGAEEMFNNDGTMVERYLSLRRILKLEGEDADNGYLKTQSAKIAKVTYSVDNLVTEEPVLDKQKLITVNKETGLIEAVPGYTGANELNGKIFKHTVTVTVTDIFGNEVTCNVPVEVSFKDQETSN